LAASSMNRLIADSLMGANLSEIEIVTWRSSS